MSLQSCLRSKSHIILFAAILSGCVAAGKAGISQQLEIQRDAAAVLSDRHPAAVPGESFEGSTLEDYLLYAALHNPDLEAAFNRWKASLERIPQVQSLPDPRLTYTYYMENVETRVGPQRNKIDIMQTFPWHGTRGLRGEVAGKEAETLLEKFEALKTSLFYKVRLTYFEYCYLSQAIDITKKNLELLTALEQAARIRYTSGKASYADVIKAQVEIAVLEERLMGLNDQKKPLVADFNALLNRDAGKELPAPSEISGYNLTLSEESLFALMKEANSELHELAVRIDRESVRIDLAKKQYYPELTVGLSYIDTGEARMPGVSGSGKDPLMAMFTVNLPLWRSRYRAAVREAELDRTSAEASKTARENALAADLSRTLTNYRTAERKILLYKEVLIPKARESLDVSILAYTAGTVDFLNLLHAQTTLLDLELMYDRVLSNRARFFSEMEMLAGKDFEDSIAR